MAIQNTTDLKARANVVKGETANNANTANRVGSLFFDVVDSFDSRVSNTVSLINQLETDLLDGVTSDGDTLSKLRALIATLAGQTSTIGNQVNTINNLLLSNDISLDTLQEIVSFIKNNQIDIDSLLSGKLDKTDKATESEVIAQTEDTKYITSFILGTWLTSLLARTLTWTGNWIFQGVLRMDSLTANKWLKLNANNEIVTGDIAISDVANLSSQLDTKVESTAIDHVLLFGVYESVAAANAAVPTSKRSLGVFEGVNMPRKVGINNGIGYSEYWWYGGTADINLVEVDLNSTQTQIVSNMIDSQSVSINEVANFVGEALQNYTSVTEMSQEVIGRQFYDSILQDNINSLSGVVDTKLSKISIIPGYNVIFEGSGEEGNPYIVKTGEITITAGENLELFGLVYLNSDGKWYYADYLDESRIKTELALVIQDIPINSIGTAIKYGTVDFSISFGYPAFTTGKRYCVSATGSIQTEDSIPDIEGIFIRYVGTAISTTELFFDPSKDYIETTLLDSENNAVQSVTGTAVDNTDPANPVINSPDLSGYATLNDVLLFSTAF
jgi:hypothetical protein